MAINAAKENRTIMKLSKILLVACLVFAVLGFCDVGNAMMSGFCRAMAAVLFILTFITRMFEGLEAMEPK